MPKDYPRHQRVGDQIQRELATLIRTEVKDPRLAPMLTVAEVRVSPDLGQAKIFISVLNGDGAASVQVLNQASGFLRRQLGRLLHMRHIPQLSFVYDTSTEQAMQMDSLINAAVASDQAARSEQQQHDDSETGIDDAPSDAPSVATPPPGEQES